MIAVAIITIIFAVALPIYEGYVITAREGVLVNNISTIEIFRKIFSFAQAPTCSLLPTLLRLTLALAGSRAATTARPT